MKKAYLKPQMKCVILFTIDDLYDGNVRKPPKYTKIQKAKTKEKIPRLVALPSLRLQRWRPTVFRTYPRWDGNPILVGQRNTGLGAEWADSSPSLPWY